MGKKKWQVNEEKAAKAVRGRLVAGSGCVPTNKGDVQSDEFLVEAKDTDKASFSIKASTWKKIDYEAFCKRKRPLMCIQIGDLRLMVMNEDDFVEMGELAGLLTVSAEKCVVHAAGLYAGITLCGGEGKCGKEEDEVTCDRCIDAIKRAKKRLDRRRKV